MRSHLDPSSISEYIFSYGDLDAFVFFNANYELSTIFSLHEDACLTFELTVQLCSDCLLPTSALGPERALLWAWYLSWTPLCYSICSQMSSQLAASCNSLNGAVDDVGRFFLRALRTRSRRRWSNVWHVSRRFQTILDIRHSTFDIRSIGNLTI